MNEIEGSQRTKGSRYRVCGPSMSGRYHIKKLSSDGEHWLIIKRGFFGQHTLSFGTYLEASNAAHGFKEEEKIKRGKRAKYKEVEI